VYSISDSGDINYKVVRRVLTPATASEKYASARILIPLLPFTSMIGATETVLATETILGVVDMVSREGFEVKS
jgi:hypothetical protein